MSRCQRRAVSARAPFTLLTLLPLLAPIALAAQRPARVEDFLGVTLCERSVAVTRLRADIARNAELAAEVEAHEAVHRRQAAAFPTCEAWVGSLTSARHIIDAEIPAYCAQLRVAAAAGADPTVNAREYAWRIAAQSGAMENRLDVLAMFRRDCPT